MEKDERMNEKEKNLILVDEEGREHEFVVIDIFEMDEKQYAVLQPVDDESEEAIILRFEQDAEGNDILTDIEDDEEWEKAADYWEENLSFEE